MSRTLTSCPACYDGKRYEVCGTCDGTGGHDPDARKLSVTQGCPTCDGAGEIEVQGCDVCGGAGSVRFGLMRIEERGKRPWSDTPPVRVLRADPEVAGRPDPMPGCRHPVFLFEQDSPGHTNSALAAWRSMRRKFRSSRLLRIRATALVTEGGQAMSGVAVECDDTALYLTGVSWGYGGEGPNGLAAILDDLEFFPDYDSALSWVAGQKWEPPAPGGPVGVSPWTLAGVGPAE